MKVVITRRIPQIAIDMLMKEGFEVVSNQDDETLSKEEMIKRLSNADAAITSLVDTIDREVMEKSKSVRIYSNFAVGFNNFDVVSAKELGVMMTNTPDVLSDTTAETAWALLFAVARRAVEADRYVRSGKWKSFRSDLMLGQDIHSKTVGIIGAGRIGRKFIEKTRGFNMRILYHNRSRDTELEREYGAEYVSLDELVSKADIISLHVPLTGDTNRLITERELRLMKKNAIIINTARGQVIDEKALAKALKEKWIFGAGLDVYENEPDVTEELIGLDNVVMFPHIGSASVETRDTMAVLCAENVIGYLKDGKIKTPVVNLI